MEYLICQHLLDPIPNKKKEIIRYDDIYSEVSTHASQRALDIAFDKCRKKDIYKVLIPNDIKIGYKFYDKEGNYFGEIIKESNNIWIIKRPKDIDLMDCMVLKKEHVRQKFIDGYFKVVEEENEN